MSEVSYVLPPTDEMYDVLLQGLKRFSEDLQTGATDSSALGYGWSPAPFAAKISAPRLLRPKPPSLSLSLRDAEVRPPAPASARTAMPSTPERPRRPSSAGRRNDEPLPRMSGRGPNGAQTASELKLKAQGQLTLPPPKSSRQRSQKNLHMAKPFKTNALMQPPVQPGTETTDRAERAERTGPTSASQLSPQVLPAMHKQPRSLEEHIASSSQRLLVPGKPTLVWKTVDSEADYRQLRGEYFNHFQKNRVLTTKAGLAQSLKEYSTSSGINADTFFPRCYDTAQKSERDDFILDFRRSSALRVALLHRRMRRDQQEGLSSSYMCNETILEACHLVLQRWLCDLDPEHLDEESTGRPSPLSEESWDALTLYSSLAQSELLQGTAERKRPRETRAEAALPLKRWPEFLSHRWGPGESESLETVLTRLESLFPQWSLHGGWLGQNVWIVKPGSNSKGSGIECFSKLTELLQHVDRMPNRICQKYVERPLLLFSGRKFDIRQWVLVRSVQPLKVFLFSECYLRLCNGMYDLGDLRDRERHISNWQVNKHGKNVVEGAVVSLQDFREELEALTGLQDYWERQLLPQLKHIVIEVMRATGDLLTPRAESFEVFGFDVMVDEAMKLWLLEVNLSPGCESRTTFMEKMLTRMSDRLVEVAVLGREAPDGEEPDWIKIYDDSGNAGNAASGPPRSAEDLRIQGTQLRIGKTKGASKPQEAHVAFTAEEADRSSHESKEKVRKGTGYVSLSELPDDEEERGVTFEVGQAQQNSGETRKSVRKGTGFLHPSDLPDDDEEEEEEREVRFTTPQAAGGGGTPKEKVRKGTGYVALSDLPDDEEEETNRGVSFEVGSQASNGQGQTRKSVRKGTGFLHPSDLPDSDDEEEEEREVRFTTPQAAGGGGTPKEKVRKGTGYVALSDLPDDEEDLPSRSVSIQAEGEQGQPKPKVRQDTGSVSMSELGELEEGSVSFNLTSKAGQSSGEPKEKVRKGTGFVSLSDLPPSDDEDVAPSVSFQVNEGGGRPKAKAAVRKGTGFVDASEILDEEEDEDNRVKFEAGTDTGEAKVQKVKKARRDTGFVSHSDIPDEEEAVTADAVLKGSKQKAKGAVFVDPNDLPDDAEDGVRFNLPAEAKTAKTKPVGPKVKARRGTGFVQESELEDADAVSFLPSSGSPPGKAKKGTGFVNLADLPPSDDEDDAAARVSFQVDEGSVKPKAKKAVRKGTGFVDASEILDEEEEDEEQRVKFAAGTDGEVKAKVKKARRGTGFVQESELPPDDSQEGSVSFDLPAQAKQTSEMPKAKVRKGTGFVNVADLPVSDDEEEVTTRPSLKAKKSGAAVVSPNDLPPDEDEDAEAPRGTGLEEASVSFDLPVQAKQSSEPKAKVRKGTGFVNAGDLPVSDEEEEEVTRSASFQARKGGAVVVNTNDLPPDDDEETEERGVRFNTASKAETAQPKAKARRGTGFVPESELPDDDEEFEDDFEEESGGEESP